jgi:hypothetical protein
VRKQFFGDINDYHKYGLLRELAGNGDLKIGVCWMLTPDDGTHGDKTPYLRDADRWQSYDPELFAKLHEWVVLQNERDVACIEQCNVERKLLPSALYYRTLVPEIRSARVAYIEAMLHKFEGLNLIFFDPDNGFEVVSRPYKNKPSRKHVYFHELKSAFERGHSILVIQFFPRKEREEYINNRVRELKVKIGAEQVVCLRTANVAYFLALHSAHAERLTTRVASACEKWPGQISLCALASLREVALPKHTCDARPSLPAPETKC